MRCSDFERKLSPFLRNTLSRKEQDDCLCHLEICSNCQETVRIAQGDFDLEPHDLPEEFVSTVLAQTSGKACSRVRHQLCDFVEGVRESEYSRFIKGHLSFCRECRALFVALSELNQVLPEIALLEPDPSFTSDVMEAISAADRKVVETAGSIRRALEALFQRPRFSWEAAYLGTLLVVAVWGGLGNQPGLDRSSHFLAGLQFDPRELCSQLVQEEKVFQSVGEFQEKIEDGYRDLKSEIKASATDASRSVQLFSGKSREYLALKSDQVCYLMSNFLGDLWESLPIDHKPGDVSEPHSPVLR